MLDPHYPGEIRRMRKISTLPGSNSVALVSEVFFCKTTITLAIALSLVRKREHPG